MTPDQRASAPVAQGDWPLPLRVTFRFAFVLFTVSTIYLVPATIPFVAELTQPLTVVLSRPFTWLTNALFPSSYGTIAWFRAYLLTYLAVAASGTLIWSLVDRRTEYRTLHRGLRIYLRYFLALVVIGHGVSKLIPVQFPRPPLTSLITPLGELGRPELLGSMMGSSPAYVALAGVAEVIGALLLFSTSTTTLGALILLLALANVVALNWAYEGGVQFVSTVYLLIAVFLLAPAVPRLVAALRPDRTDVPTGHRRRFPIPAVKWSLVGLLVVINFGAAVRDYRSSSDGVPLPRLYGIYQVDRFEASGAIVTSIARNETVRWHRLAIGERGRAAIQPIRGPVRHYRVRDDTATATLFFDGEAPADPSLSFRYGLGAEGLLLRGTLGGDSVEIWLHPVDSSALRLRQPVQ